MLLIALLENFVGLTLLKSREFIFLIEKILCIKNEITKATISEVSEIKNIEPVKTEKITFELYLTEKISDQSNKIKAIKLLREIAGLELRAAKELIDKAPVTIKKDLLKDDAEKLLKKCEGIDAKFEIR